MPKIFCAGDRAGASVSQKVRLLMLAVCVVAPTAAGAMAVRSTMPTPQQRDQFMAICTEKAEHDGKEFALTAWLESRDSADAHGKAHEQKTRGHRWRIAERKKPEHSTR